MVTQKSRFFLVFFGLVGSFIDWFSLHSITQTHCLFVSESVIYMFSQTQPVRISWSLSLTCQSIILKLGSQTLNQAVIPWVILCSLTVREWVILCSVSVSQSGSHFMFSICLPVSNFMFNICQSVSHFMFSICQSVSHFMFSIS